MKDFNNVKQDMMGHGEAARYNTSKKFENKDFRNMCVAEWAVLFRDCTFINCDLSGLDLYSDIFIEDCKFINCKFDYTVLDIKYKKDNEFNNCKTDLTYWVA